MTTTTMTNDAFVFSVYKPLVLWPHTRATSLYFTSIARLISGVPARTEFRPA